MIAHAKYARKKLKTAAVRMQIVGGNSRLCAEKSGYYQDGDGLKAGFSPVPVQPETQLANVWFAAGLPGTGFSVLVTKFGQYFRWNTTNHATLQTAGVLSNVYPFVIPYNSENGERGYLIYSGNRRCYMAQNSSVTGAVAHKFYCGAIHCGRVFARDYNDPYLVYWSGFNAHDWERGENSPDGAGEIRLKPAGGGVVAMADVGDRLVLVRETGLTVIKALGDARNFRVELTENIVLPRVYPHTAVVCLGKLWFCTRAGLYCYGGSSPELFVPDLGDVEWSEYEVQSARCFDGRRIYLICTRGGENCLLEYDAVSGVCTPFGNGCHTIFYHEDGAYCFRDKTLCKLEEGAEDESRFWLSKEVNLGTQKPKTLKKIFAEGTGGVRVQVLCDGRAHTPAGLGESYVGERGVNFSFKVTGVGTLRSLTAEWEVTE